MNIYLKYLFIRDFPSDLSVGVVTARGENLRVRYACVDFKDSEGNIYDVDVYMEQEDATYRSAKLILHKVNGEVVAQK